MRDKHGLGDSRLLDSGCCATSLPQPHRVILGLDPGICNLAPPAEAVWRSALPTHVYILTIGSAPPSYSSMGGFVYIMAHQRRGATYIGVTNNLARRVYEHRSKTGSIHTRSYNIARLVWYEEHADIRDAIQREKSLKKWKQAWKYELIENANPHWDDLWEEVARG